MISNHVNTRFRCMMTLVPGAAIRVEGPIEHTVIGLLAHISGVLAGASITILAQSTYDTDYVLVPGDRLDEAVERLGEAGFAPYA